MDPRTIGHIEAAGDAMEHAGSLIEEPGVTPSAPALLAAAALEEFLRTWCSHLEIDIQRPTLNKLKDALQREEKLTRAEARNIEAWASRRNAAAHGEWDEVGTRAEIRLMLDGSIS